MASVAEMIALAEHQQKQNALSDPLRVVNNAMRSFVDEVESNRKHKKLMELINNGDKMRDGVSFKIDPDGRVTTTIKSPESTKYNKPVDNKRVYDLAEDLARADEDLLNDETPSQTSIQNQMEKARRILQGGDVTSANEFVSKQEDGSNTPLEIPQPDVKVGGSILDNPILKKIIDGVQNVFPTVGGGSQPSPSLGINSLFGTQNLPIPNEDLTKKAIPKTEKVKPENVTLPSEIRTTSQAVNHLVASYGMTKDEAVKWIRENTTNANSNTGR